MDLSLPFYMRLVSVPGVGDVLAAWQGGPALFPDGQVPGTAEYPCGVVFPPVTDVARDTKTHPGRAVTCSIDFYAEATGDPLFIDTLAESARKALHRKPIDVGSLGGVILDVAGPITAPSDDHLYGRRLIATLTLHDTLVHA